MLPTNDHMAPFNIVAMSLEVAAQVFEFNQNALPVISTGVNTALGFTVREGCPNRFHHETKLVGYHAE